MKVWYLAKNNLDAGKDDHEAVLFACKLLKVMGRMQQP